MPFQSIEPRRLYRQIADQIRGLIGSGEFPAGSRLPPERDLARQLGVSRPSVREALIALEVEGLVEVRIGSGIYVMAPNVQAIGECRRDPRRVGIDLRARYVIERMRGAGRSLPEDAAGGIAGARPDADGRPKRR
jgi:DNA-binding FadR family transcriptional regulator